jgi:hypothetical protein
MVIPHFEAGHPRVTHPFATDRLIASTCLWRFSRFLMVLTSSKLSLGTSPFDLHVLGTPPAFILSQDQTLRTVYVVETTFELTLTPNFRGTFLSLFSC